MNVMVEPTQDIDGAAKMLNVDTATVMRLAGAGQIEGAKIGKGWVFLTEDILAYLKNRVREQTEARRAAFEGSQDLANASKRIPSESAAMTRHRRARGGRTLPQALGSTPAA